MGAIELNIPLAINERERKISEKEEKKVRNCLTVEY